MDFRARIIAELDAKEAQAQIQNLVKNEIKIPIKLDMQNADINKMLGNLQKQIKVPIDTSGLEKGSRAAKGFESSMSKLSKFQFKLNTQGVSAELSKIQSQIDRFSQKSLTKGQKDQVTSIVSSYKELKNVVNDINAKEASGTLDSSDIDEYNQALKTTQNQIKILSNELSGMSTATDRIKLTSQMQSWLNNNTKATKEARVEIERYIEEINSMGSSMTKGQLNDYTNQFKQVTAEMQAQGKVGKSYADDFKRAFGQIFQFAGAYGFIQNIAFEVPRQMVQAVKDINAAQIELAKVSDASSVELSNYWSEAEVSAKKYGATISDVINSTADWSRLGYSLKDAKQLSDATTLMQKVGDNMTQESSSEGIISTLKGFQMEADEVTKIIDEVNEVANTQPIDTSGIFEGLSRSASSMSAANNTLEQTIALITSANSVVQDPASVGM